MAISMENVKLTGFTAFGVAATAPRIQRYEDIYENNHHRIYSLAYWMTASEVEGEELMANVFCRAFAYTAEPTQEQIDRALVSELRELMTLGPLTLDCTPTTAGMGRNVKRIHLEEAVKQLPATERIAFLLHDVESYSHDRISALLGLTQEESRSAVYQARLSIRELVSRMY